MKIYYNKETGEHAVIGEERVYITHVQFKNRGFALVGTINSTWNGLSKEFIKLETFDEQNTFLNKKQIVEFRLMKFENKIDKLTEELKKLERGHGRSW